jgi:hypothetical protein
MYRLMAHAGLILVLLLALFLGVVASVHAVGADTTLASRDESTGPFNPNLPSPDALSRRGA